MAYSRIRTNSFHLGILRVEILPTPPLRNLLLLELKIRVLHQFIQHILHMLLIIYTLLSLTSLVYIIHKTLVLIDII